MIAGGGPQSLDAEHGGAVAQQTDDGPVGPGQLDAQGTADAPPNAQPRCAK